MYRELVFRLSVEIRPTRNSPGETAAVETSSEKAFRVLVRALRRSGVRVSSKEKIVRQESIHVIYPRPRKEPYVGVL